MTIIWSISGHLRLRISARKGQSGNTRNISDVHLRMHRDVVLLAKYSWKITPIVNWQPNSGTSSPVYVVNPKIKSQLTCVGATGGRSCRWAPEACYALAYN